MEPAGMNSNGAVSPTAAAAAGTAAAPPKKDRRIVSWTPEVAPFSLFVAFEFCFLGRRAF